MKNYLVRFLVWLLRKVRGEDPAPTVELGSRIVFDGVEYVCTCAELDTAPILNGTQLQMFFFRWEAMKETLRIAHPMPTDIEITVDYSLADYELAMAEEIKNDWGVPPETANKGHQRNDALDCRRYAQTALEMQGVASVSVLEPAPACADYSKCRNCLCNDCAPCQRGPVHPCQSCGDRPDPPLAVGQRCPSRELWKH